VPRIPTTTRVIVVASAISDSFMRDDLRILHRWTHVVPHEISRIRAPGGQAGRLSRLALNWIWYIYRLVRYRPAAVIFWFASPHYTWMAALARVVGIPVLLVTGGEDSVYLPELDWGGLKRPWQRRAYRLLLRLSNVVLPFSDASAAEIARQYRPRRMRTAYPSIDTILFGPVAVRQRRVVTCCYQYSARNIAQKGLDQFVETARRLPAVQFALVGEPMDEAARQLQNRAPENVQFLPRIPRREVYRDLLAGSSVYLQLSAHEGFGVSLAEAMACGCVPVVANRFSLPEVVGEAGFSVPYGEPKAAAEAVRRALDADCVFRAMARDRVTDRFSRAHRIAVWREELDRVIPELKNPPLRIELGCGSTGVPGTIGVDARKTVQTRAVCDVQSTCFASGVADEVYSFCVLEHLDNPYNLMDEVARILKPDGRAFLRVPNLGTFSSHLDTTHRFLADLKIWRGIMEGYFERVRTVPLGTKYRDSWLLLAVNWVLVHTCRFHELTQGWTFICERKRRRPTRYYEGWWHEQQDR
jgi:glycosyltransferase involved in cell wall biosynthesis